MLDSPADCNAISFYEIYSFELPPNVYNIKEIKLILRKKTIADINDVTKVTIAAFNNLAVSHQTEQYIINALRDANALILSLVAEIDGRIVGHIAFSPVIISDGTKDWYGLGPISASPEYQKQGIGKFLVNEGLSLLKELCGQGCALV